MTKNKLKIKSRKSEIGDTALITIIVLAGMWLMGYFIYSENFLGGIITGILLISLGLFNFFFIGD